MLDTILNHKSIRRFINREVDAGIVSKIVEAGTRASTTGNMQVYSIIVNKDPEIRKKLWELHFRQDMVLQAPLILSFCADFNRFNKWCRLNNAEPGYDNFLSFITAAIDALLVAQNICIAAEDHGLGICYLGTATYNADKIVELLKLPEAVVPVAAIAMGYPAEEPGLSDRLPLRAVLHYEEYQDFSDQEIMDLYSEKEGLESSKAFVAENKLENLAQVFTQVRYKKEDNRFFSRKYLELIRKQGFMDQ
jgi:nitroreductase